MFDITMLDFPRRLKENAPLLSLLSHYAQLGSEDRTIWQDRLMAMEGIEPKHLTELHGELIAFDWIEQNTGHARLGPAGTLTSCYRVTQQGLREYRHIHGIEVTEEQPAPEKSPRMPRKKKEKPESQVASSSEQSGDSMA